MGDHGAFPARGSQAHHPPDPHTKAGTPARAPRLRPVGPVEGAGNQPRGESRRAEQHRTAYVAPTRCDRFSSTGLVGNGSGPDIPRDLGQRPHNSGGRERLPPRPRGITYAERPIGYAAGLSLWLWWWRCRNRRSPHPNVDRDPDTGGHLHALRQRLQPKGAVGQTTPDRTQPEKDRFATNVHQIITRKWVVAKAKA